MTAKEPIEEKLEKLGQAIGTDDSLVENVMSRIDARPIAEASKTDKLKNKLARRFTMNRFTKLAAAAVIIIAVLAGIHYFGGSIDGASVAWGEVVRSILVAQTASFDLTIEKEDQPLQTSHFLCRTPGQVKQIMSDGTTNIVDYQHCKVLILDTNDMTATLRDTKFSGDPVVADVLNEVQKLIEKLLHNSDESVQFLGRKLIDRQEAIGFRAELTGRDKIIPWQGKGTFTVWADPETQLPIRLEWYSESFGVNTVITNIRLNVELDESTFEMRIPEGYTLEAESREKPKAALSLSKTADKEKKIIEGFRGWVALTGGDFPSSLTVDAFKDIDPNATVSFNQKGWGFKSAISFSNLKVFDGKFNDDRFDKDHLPTEEELEEIKEEFQREFNEKFLPHFKKVMEGFAVVFGLPADSDWHYAGKGVTVEDTDTPIFWYRPTDSETYRVIYGDLSIEHVAYEDLPK